MNGNSIRPVRGRSSADRVVSKDVGHRMAGGSHSYDRLAKVTRTGKIGVMDAQEQRRGQIRRRRKRGRGSRRRIVGEIKSGLRLGS